MNDDMDSLESLLDNDDWIEKFEEIDKSYSNFYLEDVYSLKLYFIYVDQNHNIQKIKHERRVLHKPNLLSREEIISIIKDNCEPKRQSLITILKYNIDLDNRDIKDYLRSNRTSSSISNSSYEHMTSIKNIDEIPFNRTISMFQDLNNLFFLFLERPQKSKRDEKNKTRRRGLG